jgi:hypothetical protein
MKRIEIGFGGGQVMSVRLDDEALNGLRKSLGKDGWHSLESEDGPVSLDLSEVVFVREAAGPHSIGFTGN